MATCPNCDSILTRRERADGWCDACGKQLPSGLCLVDPWSNQGYAAAVPRAASPRVYLTAWVAGFIVFAAWCVLVEAWTQPSPGYTVGIAFWSLFPSAVAVAWGRDRNWDRHTYAVVYVVVLIALVSVAYFLLFGGRPPR